MGGHNILEPAAHGKPVFVGPYMFNFKEIFELLQKRDVCIMAKNEADFTEKLMALLADKARIADMGRKALEVVRENQGATRRNIENFEELIGQYHVKLKEAPDEL